MSAPAAAQSGRPSSSLHFVVGEMSGKLDQIMASLLPTISALQAADTALDTRVTSIELWQSRMLGGGSVILFLIASFEVIRSVYPYVLHH